jgi:predicted enzyme related to lactoylglutathione lyase
MQGFEGYPLYTAGPGELGGGMGKRGEMAGQTVRNYIAVDDIDARVEKAKAAGASVIRPPFEIQGVGRIAILRGPGGAVFALMTPSS